ncbi:exo-beta-N-acetylmuramidase NamZ family protein [Gracilimonas halophila]|uniref:Exo-beta-N-acetylmuramidase NamZ domain-containing protein n=1 Tax=Gracilimonas halophila TaxID=1834464 RepID=A0ABW5JIQ2_9BACT
MRNHLLFILTVFILFTGCNLQYAEEQPKVKLGIEVLLEDHLQGLEGKRVGLLMNPTSRVNGVHMVDTLMNSGVNVTALFAAEHGFRGQSGAGEVIEDGIDQETGLPVFSLYGSSKKPTAEMLEYVDVILFDLPDMGVRFYTYSATMGLVMEALAENDKELWILDRPNPLGGEYVAGWILQEEYKSFVGFYPTPVIYGMTMGELAQMAVGEGWLELEQIPNYRIIKTAGWQRDMIWPETGLEWIAPSPNLPTFEHAFAYAGTVIFEGTNLSEGRGTENPFLMIGSPDLNFSGSELDSIQEKHSVRIDSVTFEPRSIPGKALSPKLEGELCYGFHLSFPEGYSKTDPLKLGLALLEFNRDHTDDFEIKPFANNLFGIDLKTIIENKAGLPSWEDEVASFKKKRADYLLY